MQSGTLNNRIEFLRHEKRRGDYGSESSWATHSKAWAAVEYTSVESGAGEKVTTKTRLNITLRYRAEIVASMRVVVDGISAEIVGVTPERRSGMLMLIAEAVT